MYRGGSRISFKWGGGVQFCTITSKICFPFQGLNCTPPAIDDFPSDLLSEDQRREGAILVHIVVTLYLFVALAVVCDNYFVPAVEKICHGEYTYVISGFGV